MLALAFEEQLWTSLLTSNPGNFPMGQTLWGMLSSSQGRDAGFVLLFCSAWNLMDMDVATQQFTANTDLQPLRQEAENKDWCHGQGQTSCTPFILLVLE